MKLVCVLSKHNKPLMPCSPAKARILIKQGKAKTVRLTPFTIQLIYGSSGYTQPITLGVDSGYSYVGLSAVTDKKELLSVEAELRTDIPKLLTERRMYRRNRRNNLWYRPARFDNRTRPDGWLAPSVQHKLDSHIRLVKLISSILPISRVIIETASFDIQKIKNPDIAGADYQNGDQKGFWNTREYVLHRDNHTCQACKGKSKDKILNVHHITPRSQGGTDRPDNLITLCETCHKKLHAGQLKVELKPAKSFKPETFMSIVRWKLVNTLRNLGYNVSNTYGYLTKDKRITHGLDKSHATDAFCIANGSVQPRADTIYLKQVRRNNRSLELFYDAKYIDKRDGKVKSGKELSGEPRQFRLHRISKGRRSVRRSAYGYHAYDRVKYNGHVYTVAGIQNHGKYIKLKEPQKAVQTNLVTIYKYASGFADVTREVLHKKQKEMEKARRSG